MSEEEIDNNMVDAQEHFWGVELTKDKPSYTWSFTEDEDDEDFLVHTLFLKSAVLGNSAVKGERNIVYIETKNFDKKDVKQPLFSLTLGQLDMCSLDISFGIETEVTFRLGEGCGPVALGGQHLVEFPGDDDDFDSQDESALDDDDLTEDDSPKKGAKKRKAGAGGDKKSKKGKMDESMSSADDSLEEDEEDDEDDDDDEDEEMEEEEKGKKKGAKGKKGPKTTKVSPKKAAKKTTKKGKK